MLKNRIGEVEMRRARRRRCVGFLPHFYYFGPCAFFPQEYEERRENSEERSERGDRSENVGEHLTAMCGGRGEEVLKVDELESIRLKDLLGLTQEEAARRMGISQPTFHRILQSARRKIASALVEGKALRIEGGDFVLVGSNGDSDEQTRDQMTQQPHTPFLNPSPPPQPPQPLWMPPCRRFRRGGDGKF